MLADGTKQGQDVKALMFLSPVRKFKATSMSSALKAPIVSGKGIASPLIVGLFWGEDNAGSDREGGAVFTALVKSRTDPDELQELDQEERWVEQSLFQLKYGNDAIGEDLFTQGNSRKAMNSIGIIIRKKLVDNSEDFRWQDRSAK